MPGPSRPCLVDGCWSRTATTYCGQHKPRAKPRPYRYRPQYSGTWQRQSREQRARVPWCQACGATADLVADHIVPGDASAGLQTLCRPCNSRRARAMTQGRGVSSIADPHFPHDHSSAHARIVYGFGD